MKYLSWNTQKITDFASDSVGKMYDKGYVFTRIGHAVMIQTRSVRIDLAKFELTSENRRILKKTDGLNVSAAKLPFKDYDYKIGKLAKDFYETKFGHGTMSAQKIKEMLTDPDKSNFNSLLSFGGPATAEPRQLLGYAICFAAPSFMHYSYPFYDLSKAPKDMGLGMMIRAIEYARQTGAKYAYLGSLQNRAGLYKLQFKGLEWFDGERWSDDTEKIKEILAK